MAHRSARRSSRAARDRAERAVALEASRLTELSTALWLARTVEDVMSVLVLEAGQAFGAGSAVAYVLRGGALQLAAAMGRAEDADEWLRTIPVDAALPVARATREGTPGWYEAGADLAAAFPGWAERVPHAGRFGALAALPLRAGGATLGAVGFAFDEERVFGPEDRALLAAAAAAGAVALRRATRLEDSRAAADSRKGPRPYG